MRRPLTPSSSTGRSSPKCGFIPQTPVSLSLSLSLSLSFSLSLLLTHTHTHILSYPWSWLMSDFTSGGQIVKMIWSEVNWCLSLFIMKDSVFFPPLWWRVFWDLNPFLVSVVVCCFLAPLLLYIDKSSPVLPLRLLMLSFNFCGSLLEKTLNLSQEENPSLLVFQWTQRSADCFFMQLLTMCHGLHDLKRLIYMILFLSKHKLSMTRCLEGKMEKIASWLTLYIE